MAAASMGFVPMNETEGILAEKISGCGMPADPAASAAEIPVAAVPAPAAELRFFVPEHGKHGVGRIRP